jgi:hypothetical protein
MHWSYVYLDDLVYLARMLCHLNRQPTLTQYYTLCMKNTFNARWQAHTASTTGTDAAHTIDTWNDIVLALVKIESAWLNQIALATSADGNKTTAAGVLRTYGADDDELDADELIDRAPTEIVSMGVIADWPDDGVLVTALTGTLLALSTDVHAALADRVTSSERILDVLHALTNVCDRCLHDQHEMRSPVRMSSTHSVGHLHSPKMRTVTGRLFHKPRSRHFCRSHTPTHSTCKVSCWHS